MSQLKNKIKNFITDESGMEFLQLAGVIVISVFLLIGVMALASTIADNIQQATDATNSSFQDLLNQAGGGGGGGTGDANAGGTVE